MTNKPGSSSTNGGAFWKWVAGFCMAAVGGCLSILSALAIARDAETARAVEAVRSDGVAHAAKRWHDGTELKVVEYERRLTEMSAAITKIDDKVDRLQQTTGDISRGIERLLQRE